MTAKDGPRRVLPRVPLKKCVYEIGITVIAEQLTADATGGLAIGRILVEQRPPLVVVRDLGPEKLL